jgi:hypothetical protein
MNKPVAYINEEDGLVCAKCYKPFTKELTDEEISQVYKEVSEPFGEKRLYEIHDFARAILRKAQE